MIVHLTERALYKLKHIQFVQNRQDWGLRVHVNGGGICSGLEFLVALDNEPLETDLNCQVEECVVYVSPESAEFVDGATIDYVQNEDGEGFLVTPPPRHHTCCCDRPM